MAIKGSRISESYRRAIGEGQRRAWATKRARLPLGSKYVDSHGYTRIKVIPGAGQWKKEHVIVMEQKLGRALKGGEIVHHVDGCRSNNSPENLYLCRDNAQHMAIERQLKDLFRELLRHGIVSFSHESGAYSWL